MTELYSQSIESRGLVDFGFVAVETDDWNVSGVIAWYLSTEENFKIN